MTETDYIQNYIERLCFTCRVEISIQILKLQYYKNTTIKKKRNENEQMINIIISTFGDWSIAAIDLGISIKICRSYHSVKNN